MSKKEFLKELEATLEKLGVQDKDNIIEYYDELIEDQKESGKKEKDIIKNINMNDITKEVKVHEKINAAVKKPSLSNGTKALIAFLGVLSFPLLITVGALVFGLSVAILAVMFSLVVTLGALVIGGIASFVTFTGGMIMGTIPIPTGLLGIGLSLILTGIMIMLVRWGYHVSLEMISWFSQLIKKKYQKYKGDGNNE